MQSQPLHNFGVLPIKPNFSVLEFCYSSTLVDGVRERVSTVKVNMHLSAGFLQATNSDPLRNFNSILSERTSARLLIATNMLTDGHLVTAAMTGVPC